MDENNVKSFVKTIGVKFLNSDLINQVFIHRSYLNENKGIHLDHNERLEFLGDAVLELVVTEYLYKNYPNPEGELTNWRSALVKGESLSETATKLNMERNLKLSKGEQASTGKARQLILANTMEALIGAIYLDRGYKKAQDFIDKFIIKKLPKILRQESYIDAKSKLQELVQDKFSITPDYRVISESGPDHNKNFVMAVYLGEKKLAHGNGSSKQEAEQDAAKAALKIGPNQ